ncbi:MAG: hypothetical protein KatS3mg043_0577 [Rhodothermaceae bacterium]|nr:MAG: hypothetical protein KatS3mg043_0577 [Rhodothermaceae bacterium]
MRCRTKSRWYWLLAGLVLAGCAREPAGTPSSDRGAAVSADTAAAEAVVQTYEATGVVRNITPSRDFIVIEHEAIPGFMDAMTMPFALHDTTLVAGIARGDRVRFDLIVENDRVYVRRIEKVRE